MQCALAVVMPVYNEEACIVEVVKAWHEQLSGLKIDFRIILLNDGSRDGTAERLRIFEQEDKIIVVNKSNSGHGATILLGYRQAIDLADWVFQCDSDDEMKPDHFGEFWRKREEYDALLGVRQDRLQDFSRKIVSAVSRWTVYALCGREIQDVNVPYRLIRRDILKRIVDQIDHDIFAPNVVISGALSRMRVRIWQHPVPHESRRTGKVSIRHGKLLMAAVKAFVQTWQCLQKIR